MIVPHLSHFFLFFSFFSSTFTTNYNLLTSQHGIPSFFSLLSYVFFSLFSVFSFFFFQFIFTSFFSSTFLASNRKDATTNNCILIRLLLLLLTPITNYHIHPPPFILKNNNFSQKHQKKKLSTIQFKTNKSILFTRHTYIHTLDTYSPPTINKTYLSTTLLNIPTTKKKKKIKGINTLFKETNIQLVLHS